MCRASGSRRITLIWITTITFSKAGTQRPIGSTRRGGIDDLRNSTNRKDTRTKPCAANLVTVSACLHLGRISGWIYTAPYARDGDRPVRAGAFRDCRQRAGCALCLLARGLEKATFGGVRRRAANGKSAVGGVSAGYRSNPP